jgi:hypothetical protein
MMEEGQVLHSKDPLQRAENRGKHIYSNYTGWYEKSSYPTSLEFFGNIEAEEKKTSTSSACPNRATSTPIA